MATPKQKKLLERDVTLQCLHYLRHTGWLCLRNQQNIGSVKGYADYTCIRKGRVMFIEFKGSSGKQSDDQRSFQMDVEYYGGKYHCIKSLEELKEALQEGE